MKTFCKSLRKQALKIINFKKKIMNISTKEQQESYGNAKNVNFLKNNLKINIRKAKNIVNLQVIPTIQGNMEVLYIVHVV